MPDRPATGARVLAAKRALYRRLYELAASGTGDLRKRLASLYAPDAVWRGSHPLDEVRGVEAIETVAWRPLARSFPDLERRDLIFVGGRYQGRDLVAAMGHYCGTFREDWLGIPASGRPIYIRYGEVHHVEDAAISGRGASGTCSTSSVRPDSGRLPRASGPRRCGPRQSPPTASC